MCVVEDMCVCVVYYGVVSDEYVLHSAIATAKKTHTHAELLQYAPVWTGLAVTATARLLLNRDRKLITKSCVQFLNNATSSSV